MSNLVAVLFVGVGIFLFEIKFFISLSEQCQFFALSEFSFFRQLCADE